MTPIERAASKIREGLSIIDDDTRLAELTDEEVEWLAKAVIKSLREPSEAMLVEASKARGKATHAVSSAVWQAMIDAALGEG